MRAVHYVLLSVSLSCVVAGCGFRQLEEIRTSPGYHKQVETKRSYQDAIRVTKAAYSEVMGYDLSCVVYTDNKTAECTNPGTAGAVILITSKHTSDTSSVVDFYTNYDTTLWRKKIAYITEKLE